MPSGFVSGQRIIRVPVLAPQVQDCDQWWRIRPGGIRAHDIGLRLVPGMEGVVDIFVGGGLGGHRWWACVFEQVAIGDLLPHLEAIASVYNLHGRRDTKYKARIKILLRLGKRVLKRSKRLFKTQL